MNTASIPVLLEAATRAFLAAITVWAVLRLFRVGNVLALKAAWGLVLVAALAMPLLMGWHWFPIAFAVRVPALPWSRMVEPEPALPAALPAAVNVPSGAVSPVAQLNDDTVTPRPVAAGVGRFPAPTISNTNVDSTGQGTPLPLARDSVGERFADALRARLRTLGPALLGWVLYLGVLSALLLRLICGLGSALRLWRTAKPVSITPETELAEGLALRSSVRVASPVTVGSGVILPADYSQWDGEKLRIVLAHERSHIRQGDFYLQLLAGLYAALFWFSPLGWWLKRKLCDLGEAISDRAGLEQAASRSSYAQILLEFAALPRPTLIGVAMARSSNLSHRIERLLNESSFSQAFSGSRTRALLALLLVPAALFAATELIRVEAAVVTGSAALVAQTAPQAPAATGQSKPEQAPDQAPPPAAAPVPLPTAGAMPAPAEAPEPPDASASPDAMPALPALPAMDGVPPLPATPRPQAAPAPPDPAEFGEIRIRERAEARAERAARRSMAMAQRDEARKNADHRSSHSFSYRGKGYSYSYSSDGDSYALVTGPDENLTFSGDWGSGSKEALEKARKMAHGKFLWFKHNDKSYIVDDPALVGQIEDMYKPMEELGRQQAELGRQQEELGKRQGEMGRQQERASIPTPDISQEMARLNEAVAKLQAKKGSTVSQGELAEIESRIGAIQGKLGGLQGRIGAEQGRIGAMQGKLGAEQGKLGAEQGRIGAEQGRIAREADQKVKAIIDQTMSNGKARPVE